MTIHTPKRKPSRYARERVRKERNNVRAETMIEDEPPEFADVESFMQRRLVETIVGNARRAWRGCGDAACRRARACLARGSRCENPPRDIPEPPAVRAARAASIARRAAELREKFERERDKEREKRRREKERAAKVERQRQQEAARYGAPW